MTRATKLPCFVVIQWVVLTLSRRQANICYWMPQPWPWVKVMERSSSTFPQTHIFFVPNIKGLAQTVLMWEGKVFAAADADAAETDWKHKVTPERGDLINWYIFIWYWKIWLIDDCIFIVNDQNLQWTNRSSIITNYHPITNSIPNKGWQSPWCQILFWRMK